MGNARKHAKRLLQGAGAMPARGVGMFIRFCQRVSPAPSTAQARRDPTVVGWAAIAARSQATALQSGLQPFPAHVP